MLLTFIAAAVIAAVAFVFGLIGSMFATQATFGERLMIAFMTAAMAFIAAVMLFTRDHIRQNRTIRRVRARLIARDDTTDDEFSRHFPDADFTLMRQT